MFGKGEKKTKMTSEQYIRVAKAIKSGSEFWNGLDTDILVLFLKLAMKKYEKDAGGVNFENMSDEELELKVREAFLKYDTSAVTPLGIQQLNSVYRKGKGLGLKGHNILNRVKKLIKPEDKIGAGN
jgi:hypothetical protein